MAYSIVLAVQNRFNAEDKTKLETPQGKKAIIGDLP